MGTRRVRKRLLNVIAVVMVVGLVSAGCGSRVGASGSGGSSASSCVDTSGDSVKIGFLNSLSGTMAISEKTVHDSLLLAADQINSSGGVLGKRLNVISEDGASEPTTFAEKAG
jgi:urea transport system substrate-binding protein